MTKRTYRRTALFGGGVVALAVATVALFNVSAPAEPFTAELDFRSFSDEPQVLGSVVPASCESNPVTSHRPGDCQCRITASPCYGESCTKTISWSTNYTGRSLVGTWSRFIITTNNGLPRLYQGNTLVAEVERIGARDFAIPPAGSTFSIRRPDGAVLCSVAVQGGITSGTLDGTSCTIPVNQNSCTGRLTWTTQNATDPRVVNTTHNVAYSSVRNGTNVAARLWYGTNNIALRNIYRPASGQAVTEVLDRETLVTACAPGSFWTGSVCRQPCTAPPNSCGLTATGFVRPNGSCSVTATPESYCTSGDPDISITLTPPVIREGGDLTIEYDLGMNPPGSCTLTGSGLEPNPYVFMTAGGTGTITIRAIEFASTYTLRCGMYTTEAQVQIVPEMFEV